MRRTYASYEQTYDRTRMFVFSPVSSCLLTRTFDQANMAQRVEDCLTFITELDLTCVHLQRTEQPSHLLANVISTSVPVQVGPNKLQFMQLFEHYNEELADLLIPFMNNTAARCSWSQGVAFVSYLPYIICAST